MHIKYISQRVDSRDAPSIYLSNYQYSFNATCWNQYIINVSSKEKKNHNQNSTQECTDFNIIINVFMC